MKFCYLKKDQDCKGCGSLILKGEEAVIIRYSVQNGMVLPFAFHTQCFMGWSNQVFMYRLEKWRSGTVPKKVKKRMGRPRKYKNRLKADRIRGLLYYYKKVGDTEKVKELEEQLNKTLIRNLVIQQNGQTV